MSNVRTGLGVGLLLLSGVGLAALVSGAANPRTPVDPGVFKGPQRGRYEGQYSGGGGRNFKPEDD